MWLPVPGRTVGESMANSMAIDVLAFTGSGQVGRRLLECAGKSNLKRVYLELGGKSPNIVFKDTPDIGAAAKACAFAIFRNSGQVCVAGSRLLVEDQIYDEFVAEVSRHAAAIKVGNPLDLVSDVGAVNSLRNWNRICGTLPRPNRKARNALSGESGYSRIPAATIWNQPCSRMLNRGIPLPERRCSGRSCRRCGSSRKPKPFKSRMRPNTALPRPFGRRICPAHIEWSAKFKRVLYLSIPMVVRALQSRWVATANRETDMTNHCMLLINL